jgi:hypothetical protein
VTGRQNTRTLITDGYFFLVLKCNIPDRIKSSQCLFDMFVGMRGCWNQAKQDNAFRDNRVGYPAHKYSVVIAHDPWAQAGEESQVGEESTVIGNFTLSFEGTIYLPNQTFSFWGNSDTAVDPPISHIIANRISVGGNGTLRLRSEPGGGIQPWTQAVNIVRLIE